MQPKFASVTSLATIGDALEKLADESTDVVIVTDASGKSMGLLDKSHAVKIALNGTDLSGSVAKVMNDQPVSISTNSGTDDVYAVMRYGTTEHLPVEEDGIVVGLISVRDLIPFWSEYMDLQARRLGKNYEQVLSVMAHDLRTPIGVVKSTNQFITGGCDMSLEEYVDSGLPDIIESSCNTMLKLIDGILDLGQIRNGNIALSRELIDLEDLIDRVARCFGPLAASKKIEIEIDIPTAVPKVKADSLRIEQVINNLVSNALKFSKEKSKVVIGMKAHHSKVAFWVADNGQGIPELEQENLFSEYGTTSIKPTAGESSTGLGLAICKRIVEAHNGNIRVDSKLNEGSTFTVLLPIEEIQ
jgi:signal transduction histidine kinase